MGYNLLKHAYNHFDTHETLDHDTIFNHRIDRLPYQYVSQTLVSAYAVYAHARACIMCVRGYVCVYMHTSD